MKKMNREKRTFFLPKSFKCKRTKLWLCSNAHCKLKSRRKRNAHKTVCWIKSRHFRRQLLHVSNKFRSENTAIWCWKWRMPQLLRVFFHIEYYASFQITTKFFVSVALEINKGNSTEVKFKNKLKQIEKKIENLNWWVHNWLDILFAQMTI